MPARSKVLCNRAIRREEALRVPWGFKPYPHQLGANIITTGTVGKVAGYPVTEPSIRGHVTEEPCPGSSAVWSYTRGARGAIVPVGEALSMPIWA
jgi:hypothetical protein